MVERYAAGEGGEEGGEPKSFVSLNWVLTEEPLDLETELVGAWLCCACVVRVLCLPGRVVLATCLPACALHHRALLGLLGPRACVTPANRCSPALRYPFCVNARRRWAS